MSNCAHYVHSAKEVLSIKLKKDRVSDRELGENLPSRFQQQNIARAKSGYMTDTIAAELGEFLKKHGVIEHPGEVVLVARAEREKDVRLRKLLLDYAKNVLGRRPVEVIARAFVAVVTAAGLMVQPQPAQAHDFGGAGGIRTLDTV